MSNQARRTWKGRILAMSLSTVLCLAALEFGSRIFEAASNKDGLASLQLNMQPYMMFASGRIENPTWRNVETKSDVPSRMKFNDMGFQADFDFGMPPTPAYFQRVAKKPGEKLVILTGGSVVHGVGATANDKSISGQLEAYLNTKQSGTKYRVLNLAMGSWVAFQQFVGLSIYGLPLNPDWVVVMDGHNDAAVACPHGSGPGNVLQWPHMLYLTGGGQGVSRLNPAMQWLLGNSAAARLLTGLRLTPGAKLGQIYFDDEDPDKRFSIKMKGVTFKGLDEQVAFYLQAQLAVKESFSSANLIFSSQPYLYGSAASEHYRTAYDPLLAPDKIQTEKKDLVADLERFRSQWADTTCNNSISAQALGYFSARAAVELERSVSEWAKKSTQRSIQFASTEMVFPSEYTQRLPNFVDNAHMSDLGQRRIAEFFGGQILKTDLNSQFNTVDYVRKIRDESVRSSGPTTK